LSADGGGVPTLRLDKFLWFARLARTRSAAARLCIEGRIAIAGVPVSKPHQPIRIGDWITIEQGRWRRRLRVMALGERRTGATEARRLYFEPEPPQPIPVEPWISLLEEEAGA
jgi:ribosome-associated heat shock protein Hsp15